MLEPRTNLEDYKRWKSEIDAIAVACKEGRMTREEQTRKRAAMSKKYADKIFQQDFHYFTDELGLRIFLKLIEESPEGIEELVLHERSHFEAAIEHGCNPRYGVVRFYIQHGNERIPGYRAFVHVSQVDPKVIPLIARAPEEMSESDKRLA